MAGVSTGGGLGRLGALFACGSFGGKTDAELLEHFNDGEVAEAAFEALVIRHGPDVMKACRRVLPDPNDAEDAFQATFLVLARRASSGSFGRSESLGPWLHGVALRVARKARVAAARRRKHEGRVAGRPDVGPSQSDDLAAVLREEVERLPEPLRTPVVLCYLEEMTYQGAARRLQVSEGTIRGRLVKARSLLRSRLSRHEEAVARGRPPRVPSVLTVATIRSAMAFAPGGAGLPGLSAAVAELMEGVLTMTIVTRWMMAGAALMTICLAAAGGAALAAKGDDKSTIAKPGVSEAPPPNGAVRPDKPPDDPSPVPVLTLDTAIERLLRDMTDEAIRLEIPRARAGVLAAPGGPTQYDINISHPLDVSIKRRSRPSSRARTIAEAQYKDAVRIRIDALYSAYVDVQEMHELIRLQKQWQAAWYWLASKARDEHGTGLEPGSDESIFLSGAIGWGRSGPFGNRQGDLARARRRTLAKLIDLTSTSQSDRLHVEGITPASTIPTALELVRLATITRPDLAVHALGLQSTMTDLKFPSKGAPPVTDDHRLQQPDHIADRPEIARAKLNARQSEGQRVALGDTIRQEVERRHWECVSSLARLREVATAIDKKRRWYQEVEQKYEEGTASANEVRMTLGHLQKLELQQWELLVEHRRSILALNTAVGVRLLP